MWVRPKARTPGPNPVALGLSVLIHASLIALALLSSSSLTAPLNIPSVYKEFIAPEEKKIVWYRVQKLPPIAPEHKIGDAPAPQGLRQQARVVISTVPDAQPGNQLIWRPDLTRRIEQEVPAPDVVAMQNKPEPAKPQKTFHPPDPQPARLPQLNTPAPPDILKSMPANAAAKIDAFQSLPTRFTKAFVAPRKPASGPAPAPLIVAAAEPAVLQAQQNQQSAALDEVLRASNKLPTRPFVPPSPSKPSGNGSATNGAPGPAAPPALTASDVNAIVLNSSAIDKLVTTIPDGSRPALMSGAPAVGPTSSGAAHGLKIPGVVVQPGQKQEKPLAIPELGGHVVYDETAAATSRPTLSAPLRPSSRTLPAAIEKRFQGRVEYTIILPKPQLPIYGGDWILWFAEHQQESGLAPPPGTAPQMRAPQPVRKVEPVANQPQIHPVGRVQLAATILKDGRVDSISLLTGSDTPFTQAAINDLQSWWFRPAVRDGQTVDVDIVVEIPFQQ